MKVDKLVATLKRKEKKHKESMRRGLVKAGLYLQRESQKLVPVDLGTLKASARTTDVTTNDTHPKVEVSYGTEYAIYVHEDLTANHPNGGQAKFLEEPARTKKKEIAQIIKNEAKR